jgi:hypothetical protein
LVFPLSQESPAHKRVGDGKLPGKREFSPELSRAEPSMAVLLGRVGTEGEWQLPV